jgi:hypothetical protein
MRLEESIEMIYSISVITAENGHYLISSQTADSMFLYDTKDTKTLMYKAFIMIWCDQLQEANDFLLEWARHNTSDDRSLFMTGLTFCHLEDYGQATYYLNQLKALPKRREHFINILESKLI